MFLKFVKYSCCRTIYIFYLNSWSEAISLYMYSDNKKGFYSIPDPANTQVETDVYIVVSSLWMVNTYGFNFFPVTQDSYSLGLLEEKKSITCYMIRATVCFHLSPSSSVSFWRNCWMQMESCEVKAKPRGVCSAASWARYVCSTIVFFQHMY